MGAKQAPAQVIPASPTPAEIEKQAEATRAKERLAARDAVALSKGNNTWKSVSMASGSGLYIPGKNNG